MQVRGTTTREIAAELAGGVMNGVLRTKVLGVDALVHTNNWKILKNPTTGKEEYYLYADDVASQDPKKMGGEDVADGKKQTLIDKDVAWTKWGDPIID